MTPAQLYLLVIEIIAAVCGVYGTVVLALNGPHAGRGFVLYLASNAGWLASSWIRDQWPLFVQQGAFTVASVLGIWRWILRDEFTMQRALYRLRRKSGYGRIAALAWCVRSAWGN